MKKILFMLFFCASFVKISAAAPAVAQENKKHIYIKYAAGMFHNAVLSTAIGYTAIKESMMFLPELKSVPVHKRAITHAFRALNGATGLLLLSAGCYSFLHGFAVALIYKKG